MNFMKSIAHEFRGSSANYFVWYARIWVWVLAGSAHAQPLTHFRASFDLPGTGGATVLHASDYRWVAAVASGKSVGEAPADGEQLSVGIDAGTPSFSGEHTSSTQPSRAGFLFASPMEGYTPRAMMLHTLHLGVADHIRTENKLDWLVSGKGALVGLKVREIEELSLRVRAASIHTVMRFAIRVDGDWYASKLFFKQINPEAFEKHVINPATHEWISGVLTAEGAVDTNLTDNPSTPLNGSDEISGYGWYADCYSLAGKDALVRIDDYGIKLGILSQPYLQWAIGPFVNPFTDTDPTADSDGDGLSNLMEFVSGGDPTVDDRSTVAPSVTTDGNNLLVTFRRSDASEVERLLVSVTVGGKGNASGVAERRYIMGAGDERWPDGSTSSVNEVGTLDRITVTIPNASHLRKAVGVTAVYRERN